MKNRKRIIILGLIVSLLLAPGAAAADYSDVAPSAWYYSDVTACADLGIVTGYDGKFNPEDPVTGVQFISMLTRTFYADRLAQVSTPAGQPWYYPNLAVAEELGLDSGSVAFDNTPMNRYDMARTLYNILGSSGKLIESGDSRITDAIDSIPDYSKIPANRIAAVRQCYALGILTGMEGGNFNGDASMTRA